LGCVTKLTRNAPRLALIYTYSAFTDCLLGLTTPNITYFSGADLWHFSIAYSHGGMARHWVLRFKSDHTYDELPKDIDIKVHGWQESHVPNMTGTPFAYKPKGSLDRGGVRDAVASDYEAWTPGE